MYLDRPKIELNPQALKILKGVLRATVRDNLPIKTDNYYDGEVSVPHEGGILDIRYSLCVFRVNKTNIDQWAAEFYLLNDINFLGEWAIVFSHDIYEDKLKYLLDLGALKIVYHIDSEVEE